MCGALWGIAQRCTHCTRSGSAHSPALAREDVGNKGRACALKLLVKVAANVRTLGMLVRFAYVQL